MPLILISLAIMMLVASTVVEASSSGSSDVTNNDGLYTEIIDPYPVIKIKQKFCKCCKFLTDAFGMTRCLKCCVRYDERDLQLS